MDVPKEGKSQLNNTKTSYSLEPFDIYTLVVCFNSAAHGGKVSLCLCKVIVLSGLKNLKLLDVSVPLDCPAMVVTKWDLTL